MLIDTDKLDSLTEMQLATLLGATDRTIRNWQKKEGLPSTLAGARRFYKWSDVLGWFASRQVSNRAAVPETYGKADSKESFNDAILRKTIADANIAEKKLSQMNNELVEVLTVERTLSSIASGIQQKLLGVPAELTPRLIGQSDKHDVSAILDEKMRQVCRDLSEMTGDENV